MTQTALPLAVFACPACGCTDGWIQVHARCSCGYESTAARRIRHIREGYAKKRAREARG